MGLALHRSGIPVGSMALVLLALGLGGCVEHAVDVEPYARIKTIGPGFSGGVDCPATNFNPLEQCVEAEFAFLDFDCNPPQLAFALPLNVAGLEAPAQNPKGQTIRTNSDAYVYCEYAFRWTITGRALLPDSTLTGTTNHAGQEQTRTCKVDDSGACSISGQIQGSFRFDGPDEKVDLRASLDGRLTSLTGQPISLPAGQGSWEPHLDLNT